MGKLHVLITDSNIVTHAHSSKSTKKRRIRAVYAFDHRIVCQHAFCFLHSIGNFTLRALRKHITEAGPYPREHRSKGRKAYNAYPYAVVRDAVEFVNNYSAIYGLPQPAALRGRANQAPTYLPAYQNNKIVHEKYKDVCEQEGRPFMQYRSFLGTWHQCLPHIVFMTPRTDVCHLCEEHRCTIQRAVTEHEKKKIMSEFKQHLEEAQKNACVHFWYLCRCIPSSNELPFQ